MRNYTVKECAELLNINPLHVYRYVNSGILKSHKEGREFKISEEAISAFNVPEKKASLVIKITTTIDTDILSDMRMQAAKLTKGKISKLIEMFYYSFKQKEKDIYELKKEIQELKNKKDIVV